MLAHDLQPASMVEDRGFLAFLEAIDPKYTPPSRRTIMRVHLPALYETTKEKLMNEIATVEWCSLTTDAWTSNATEGYLTVTCHYFTSQWELRSVVLKTVHVTTRHTSENLAATLSGITNEWKITNKVACVVTDNANNMTGAIRLNHWKQLPCFAHTINLVVDSALKADPSVIEMRKACRDIVSFFHKSTNASSKLIAVQKQMSKEEHKLIQEVETRWNSTFYMLERIVEQHEAITTALCLLDRSDLCIPTTVVTVMKELIDILRPFEAVTHEVSSDTYISASKIIPLARSLQKLSGRVTSNETVSKVGEELATQMRRRFLGMENNILLGSSTMLDPRFKKLAFVDTGAIANILRSITSELVARAPSDEDVDTIQMAEQLEEETLEVGNCGADESLWQFLDQRVAETASTLTPAADATVEVNQYIKIKNIERKENAIEWWKSKGATTYTSLQHLAKKYLSVPATSVPSERLFSKAGELISKKRNRLKDKNIDMYLFLNKNLNLK